MKSLKENALYGCIGLRLLYHEIVTSSVCNYSQHDNNTLLFSGYSLSLLYNAKCSVRTKLDPNLEDERNIRAGDKATLPRDCDISCVNKENVMFLPTVLVSCIIS